MNVNLKGLIADSCCDLTPEMREQENAPLGSFIKVTFLSPIVKRNFLLIYTKVFIYKQHSNNCLLYICDNISILFEKLKFNSYSACLLGKECEAT